MNRITKAKVAGSAPKKTATTATKKASVRQIKHFHKSTITPLGFVGDVISIVTEGSTFNKVWVKRELDPRFRETLMLAVARMNDSKYCSWAHHEWAAIEGVSEEELANIERLELSHFDARTQLALSFVRELVALRFAPASESLMQKMRAAFSAEEIEEITLVAKVMDFANRSSNTFDALVSRINGKPSRTGRLLDEAVMSAAFFCALPPLMTFFSRASNSPVTEVLGRMRDYTKKMDVEYMTTKSPQPAAPTKRKRPAVPRKATGRSTQA